MARLRVVLQSRVRVMDADHIVGSIDDVYRIASWSMTSEDDRSIYLPGSRGRTWRSVEGLRIERARTGSIELDLGPIISGGAAVLILNKLVDMLTLFIDKGGLRGIRAAASLAEAEAALKAQEAALKSEEARKAKSDADLAQRLVPLTLKDKQLELASKVENAALSRSQAPLRPSEKAALRRIANGPYAADAMQGRTTVFPDLYRWLLRGSDRRKGARNQHDRLRALADAARAMGRIEEVQNHRQPMVAVQLLEEEDTLELANREGRNPNENQRA